jgi:hypothetical protein
VSEINLWSEFLWLAAYDYYGQCSSRGYESGEAIRLDAEKWFQSESREVGSFVWCANLLNLDPQWLKTKLLQEAKPRVKAKNAQARVLRSRFKRAMARRARPHPWADARLAFMFGWALGRSSISPPRQSPPRLLLGA